MSIENLERRVCKLEQSRKRWQTLSVLFVLAFCSVAALQFLPLASRCQAAGTEVRASRFVLVDANNKERGIWEINQRNEVVLKMQTEFGNCYSSQICTHTGASVALWSSSAYPLALLSTEYDQAQMLLYGRYVQTTGGPAVQRPGTIEDYLGMIDRGAEHRASVDYPYLGMIASADSRSIFDSKMGRIEMYTGRPGSTENPTLNFVERSQGSINTRVTLGAMNYHNKWSLRFKDHNIETAVYPPDIPIQIDNCCR